MSAVAINTRYVSLVPLLNRPLSNNLEEGTFNITSTERGLNLKEDTRIVIIKPQKEDLRFTNEGLITRVGQVSVIPPTNKDRVKYLETGLAPPKDSYSHNFQYSLKKELLENNLLSELEYSLKIVYSYNNPIKHFQQQMRALPSEDFDTIVHGWVYVGRTVFGKLINAIPRQNKLEFMLESMNKFETIDFSKVPLEEGLNFLYEYIDKRILSRGRLLVASQKLIEKHLADIIDNTGEIGFKNPSTDKEDTLNVQASFFDKIFSLEKKTDVLALIREAKSENAELENRFLQIFNNQTWPIDLKV